MESLSLDVERGEFISLLGPSGCGKTTTLQMVAGFVEPTRGRIRLNGADITAMRPEKRGMGVVFQSYALFPHMTVADNIGFGLEMRGMRGAEKLKRIDETLELVRLPGLGKRYPRNSRAASGNALPSPVRWPCARGAAARRADVEPRREAARGHARRAARHPAAPWHHHDPGHARPGRGHDHERPHRGHARRRIVQLATPYEAYERPESAFASSFLGKTNVLKGVVEARNMRCCEVRVGDSLLHVPHQEKPLAREVNVYVRPEKVKLAPASAANGIPATIRTRLFLGNHWLVEVDSALGPMRVSHPNIGAVPPAEGEAVALHWLDDDLRLLDTEAANG